MLRSTLQLGGLLLLGLLSNISHAAVVKDLYTAEVTVVDHSQQALASAASEALSEVLVKVSGSVTVLENPAISSALGNSRSYVQQYAYTQDDASSGELSARFEFDDSIIAGLVAEAGVPFWTANRPSVLVWMVIEGPEGRQFLSGESVPEMMLGLEREFVRRGVPSQFPLYDLDDSAIISVDELWRLAAPAIQQASVRYGVQDILAGRLVSLSNGNWAGDWSYFFERSRIDRSIGAGSQEAFLQAGADLVAGEMSARFAVAPSAKVAGGVKVLVTGVSSYHDYASIVAWLEGLELVEYANIETISGDEIRLNLVAQADAQQLAAIIELNKHLLPLASPERTTPLSYQWQK